MCDFKVLYIDDDENSLRLLYEQLKLADIEIIPIIDAEKGFSAYLENKEQLKLVLIDINMPIVDGYEILQEIRKVNKNIPIIMITATNLSDEKNKIIEMGATDCLVKPIPCTKMIDLVKDYD